MGLTWILTLIANWQQAAFLEYPSTALNSMQGIYVFTNNALRCQEFIRGARDLKSDF